MGCGNVSMMGSGFSLSTNFMMGQRKWNSPAREIVSPVDSEILDEELGVEIGTA